MRQPKYALLFLLLLMLQSLPTQALAIINAEDLNLTRDTDGLAGKFDISAKGSSGNSDKLSGEASGHMIWKHDRHLDMLVGSFSYGRSRGVRDSNKSFVHIRHRYAWNNTWGLEGFAQAQQDEFARLKLRTLIGGGIRWSYRQQGWDWHIGLGSFYERERLRTTATAPISHLWRGNTYLALRHAFNDRIRIQNTLYYQPAWTDTADYRLLDDAALHIALAENLDLKLVIEVAQDSRPPTGISHTDISYKTGLSFRF